MKDSPLGGENQAKVWLIFCVPNQLFTLQGLILHLSSWTTTARQNILHWFSHP